LRIKSLVVVVVGPLMSKLIVFLFTFDLSYWQLLRERKPWKRESIRLGLEDLTVDPISLKAKNGLLNPQVLICLTNDLRKEVAFNWKMHQWSKGKEKSCPL
jgi:hypothetical protein